MARTELPVDREILEASIKAVEKATKFPNQNALHHAACEEYNKRAAKKKLPPITFSVVMLRINAWKIAVKTPKGKRGRASMTPEQKAAMAEGRKNRKGGRKAKFAKNPQLQEHFAKLREKTPDRFKHLVDAAENGSASAARKHHCLQCCGYETKEVRLCSSIGSCPEFPYRPYQNLVQIDINATDEEVEAADKETEDAA